MKIEQKLDRCRRNHGSIAGEHDHVVVARERSLRNHERVPGAALFRLQDEVDSGGLQSFSHAFCFVPDDCIHIFHGNDLSGGRDYMRQQRLSSDFMQNFRKLRLQPSSLASGHNRDSDARGSYGRGSGDGG